MDFVARLSAHPGKIFKRDFGAMHSAGLSDEAILDANLPVANYAYVKRIGDGVTVPLEDHMMKGE
ncbi:MAG: hypothetical protein ACLFWD_09560 [Anaerolineales bacterium]